MLFSRENDVGGNLSNFFRLFTTFFRTNQMAPSLWRHFRCYDNHDNITSGHVTLSANQIAPFLWRHFRANMTSLPLLWQPWWCHQLTTNQMALFLWRHFRCYGHQVTWLPANQMAPFLWRHFRCYGNHDDVIGSRPIKSLKHVVEDKVVVLLILLLIHHNFWKFNIECFLLLAVNFMI